MVHPVLAALPFLLLFISHM